MRTQKICRDAMLALSMLGSLTACASTPPPPVEIAGAEQELRSLTGAWSGSYAYLGNGRSGSIRITLAVDPKADATIAFGDVLMVPSDLAETRQVPANGTPPVNMATPQALQIRFVSVASGQVSGTMEPYRDPESGNVLSTTFLGAVKNDEISGTFMAFGGSANVPRRGTWHVRRQQPS